VKFLSLLPLLLLVGCSSYGTRFEVVTPDGTRASLEIEKEVDADDPMFVYDPKTGFIIFSATKWRSRNAESIKADGKRAEGVLDKTSNLVEKTAKGAAEGAAKGLIPIP